MNSITIPDSLRKQIIDAQSLLPEMVAEYNTSREKLLGEITAVKGDVIQLQGKMPFLQERAVHGEFVSDLLENERQLQLLKERVEGLQRQCDSFEPPSLGFAASTILGIVDFYKNAVPEAFIEQTGAFFESRERALAVAKLLDAARILPQVTNFARTLHAHAVTSPTSEKVLGIFARALAGKPHLGIDREIETEPLNANA